MFGWLKRLFNKIPPVQELESEFPNVRIFHVDNPGLNPWTDRMDGIPFPYQEFPKWKVNDPGELVPVVRSIYWKQNEDAVSYTVTVHYGITPNET